MEENQQEILFKFNMLEQEIQHLQQQIQAVEKAIIEMNSLSIEIKELEGKKGQEILAPVGKGIFVKAQLLSEELIMNVGDQNFVNKNIPESQELINGQIVKMEEIRKELNDNIMALVEELNRMLGEVQGGNEPLPDCEDECCGNCGDECEDDCSCEHH